MSGSASDFAASGLVGPRSIVHLVGTACWAARGARCQQVLHRTSSRTSWLVKCCWHPQFGSATVRKPVFASAAGFALSSWPMDDLSSTFVRRSRAWGSPRCRRPSRLLRQVHGLRLLGRNRLRRTQRRKKRVREAGGGDIVGRDNDTCAHLGPGPHLHGEGHGHPDAAVRSRAAGQHTRVHGHAGPGDPLHIGHRGAAIDIGTMKLVLWITLKTPIGVGWPGMPVETGAYTKKSVGVVNSTFAARWRSR